MKASTYIQYICRKRCEEAYLGETLNVLIRGRTGGGLPFFFSLARLAGWVEDR